MAPDDAKPLLLVIDDERGPRDSLRMLVKNEFNVLCADHVDAGLELLRRQAPDVIVMDIRMPGKTGIEGLSGIRAIDPLVSVIMLTGYGALDTARQALQLGANDYMQKPFDAMDMLENLRRHAERTQLVRRREQSLQRLHTLNTELNENLASQEQMASIGKVSAEFAHDLCSPLNVVMAYTEMLSEHLDELRDRLGDGYDRARENLESIEEGVARCRDLMIEWRKTSKGGKMQMAPFRLPALFRQLNETVEPLASAAGVTYQCEAPPACLLQGSQAQLMRALHNLLANAIQAVDREGGRVRLEARTDGPQVVLCVQDNGPGMNADQLRRVFEPGFTTKEADKGTGLGVPIANSIVEAHGGDMHYESEVGRGTRVLITLPIHNDGAAG